MSIRIPARWADMLAGDSIISRIPYHRMLRVIEHMGRQGYKFEHIPVEEGYLVTCTASPHDEWLRKLKQDAA